MAKVAGYWLQLHCVSDAGLRAVNRSLYKTQIYNLKFAFLSTKVDTDKRWLLRRYSSLGD
jgi:hypothetical protein